MSSLQRLPRIFLATVSACAFAGAVHGAQSPARDTPTLPIYGLDRSPGY
jgi:hypothetical protein